MTAWFVALEGVDGAGKSTQARLLGERLDALVTREPGGTPVGQAIRALLLDPENGDLDRRAEALLMAADRAQHVATLIRPTLASGRSVVTDRYLYSSIAYQGYGRELGADTVESLSMFAVDGLVPDVVVLLQLSREMVERRWTADPDRIEREDDGFRARVARGYTEMAMADPARWLVVDGTGTVDEVAERVWSVVATRLGLQ